ASRGRVFIPYMAPLPHVNDRSFAKYIRDNPDLTPRMKQGFLTCTDLMKVSKFRPVTPVGQLLWDEQVRAFEKATRHVYTAKEALDRGTKIVQREPDTIYSDDVPPLVQWQYPVFAALLLATLGLALIYFLNGRRQLIRDMTRGESV